MNKTLLREYARLAVRTGANVQKGQFVVIRASVEMNEFAVTVAEEAYRAGAREVRIDWKCDAKTKLDYRHMSVKNLCEVYDWQEAKLSFDCDNLPAYINIISDDPDGLKGVSSDKMQKANVAYYKRLKSYYDRMDNKYQWTIVAAAGKAWAKKVFPGIRTSTAVEKLWDAILSTVYVTPGSDPSAEWARHNADFAAKCARLNAAKFDYLEYRSSNGTDFRCTLNPKVMWLGGGETLGDVYYNPNMPTEEIFTTPVAGKCEGTLVATKPLSLRGNLVEDFSVTFTDGRVTSVSAKKGEELLRKVIDSDDGAHMIGELALVPVESPINRSGILFYNTLFDENAACHVALGAGFANLLEGFESMTKEEQTAAGINDSMIHVDFMIGCEDLDITGWKDGAPTRIFTSGTWDPDFLK